MPVQLVALGIVRAVPEARRLRHLARTDDIVQHLCRGIKLVAHELATPTAVAWRSGSGRCHGGEAALLRAVKESLEVCTQPDSPAALSRGTERANAPDGRTHRMGEPAGVARP